MQGLNDFNDVTFAFDDVLSRRKKIVENVGKFLVTEETEETPKTTCTGNQSWACGKHFEY